MGALQYFDCPNHRTIVFRRTLTDLQLPSSLLSRAKEWLSPFLKTKEVRYDTSLHTFTSREGATLAFGYLDKADAETRYQGAEMHEIYWDELTHFLENQYLYLFSRNRRNKKNDIEAAYPLRIRSGSNPGGRGGAWVKKRWEIYRDKDGEFRGHSKRRPFIQAKCSDNPYIDLAEYVDSLKELDPITRDRLLNGDWAASTKGIFKDWWFEHRWRKKGEFFLLQDKKQIRSYHQSELLVFLSVDSASSEKTGIEGRVLRNSAKDQPSWSVCGVYAMTPDFHLLHLDQVRTQKTIPFFIDQVVGVAQSWKPVFALMEANGVGQGVYQGVAAKGVQVMPVTAQADKVNRSISAQLRSEEGKIWLPPSGSTSWINDLEDELFFWTGLKGEVADQVDVLSYAAQYAASKAVGSELVSGTALGSHQSRPVARGGLRASQGMVGKLRSTATLYGRG